MADDRGIQAVPDEVAEAERQKDQEFIAELLSYHAKWAQGSEDHKKDFGGEASQMMFSIVKDTKGVRVIPIYEHTADDEGSYSTSVYVLNERRQSLHSVSLTHHHGEAFLIDPVTNEPINTFNSDVMALRLPGGENNVYRVTIKENDAKGVELEATSTGVTRRQATASWKQLDLLPDNHVRSLFQYLDTIMPQPEGNQAAATEQQVFPA